MVRTRHGRCRAHRRPATVTAAVLVLAGCRGADGPPAETDVPGPTVEVVSLLGEALRAQEDTAGAVAAADSALAGAPDDVERILEAARARAALWRYAEAIELYSRAARLAPADWRPYRHRGHRYLSIRRFDDAAADLERARELAPHSFDVSYHLGLAYYLLGRFHEAAEEYGRCMALASDSAALALEASGALGKGYRSCMSMAGDEPTRIAATEWRWRALARAGRGEEARALLATVAPGLQLSSNTAYYDDLLFHRGALPADSLRARARRGEYRFETVGYGMAVRYLVEGDTARASELLEEVAAHPHWPGFGRIAAEADLVRLGRSGVR